MSEQINNSGDIPEYTPGEVQQTPNENQRTVASSQDKDPEKANGYKDYVHPSAHNTPASQGIGQPVTEHKLRPDEAEYFDPSADQE